jgi:diguanylate cyclase (GGDEF)-like protein/PAS domain S-box-containing protein
MKKSVRRAAAVESKAEAPTISLELLLGNLPGAVYRCLNDQRSTMEFVSAGIEKLTGYPPSAFTARSAFTFASIIRPSDRQEVVNEIEAALASQRSFQATYRIITASGETKWVWEQGAAVLDATGEIAALEGFIADITRVKKSDALVLEQAALVDKARDAIFVMDMGSKITYWNKGAQHLFGWMAEEVIGTKYSDLFDIDPPQFRLAYDATVVNGEWTGECIQRGHNGSDVETEARWSLVPADESAGTPQKILAISTDISERKSAESKVYRMAFFDALTDLPNRSNLIDQLRKALMTSARDGTIGAIMFCDLDNFKALNDSKGHAAGDELLQAVARRLEQSVRETDLVARLGGDEFVIMLPPGLHTYEEAARRAEAVAANVITRMAGPIRLLQDAQPLTTSIGVTLFSGAHETVETVLMKADAAMYQAKFAGRNTTRFFDPDIQESLSAHLKIERSLSKALVDNEFVLHFQPQMNTNGDVTGAEALIRWKQDDQLVMPGEFIESAESTGQIVAIGEWVLSTACAQLADWGNRPETACLSLSVNISARQFIEPDFVPMAEAIFTSTGANLAHLKLELTENLLVTDVTNTASKMEYLKGLGVTFSLDDFGTGYSSLAYLRKLPLDELKIDYAFVKDVLVNRNDASIVRSIITLANSLGLDVIAEGVETEGQREFLQRAGCHAYQGFLYEKAMPNDRFVQFVTTRH